jgi:acylphosphatase
MNRAIVVAPLAWIAQRDRVAGSIQLDPIRMNTSVTRTLIITGDVAAPHFPGWVRRHAAKLGLEVQRLGLTNRGLEVVSRGAPEMIESLAVACSLGPAGVLVDEVV